MSGAGRGTPRVSPVVQAPPIIPNTDWVVTTVPFGPWHMQRGFDPVANDQLLTTSYVQYDPGNSRTLDLPLGATRGAILGTYTPGGAGGILGVQLRWVGVAAGEYRNFYSVDVANTVYGPSSPADVFSAESPTYGGGQTLPPAPDAGILRVFLPFWVPPMILNASGKLGLELWVRDAFATPGTFQLSYQVAENFGEAQPASSGF